MNVTTLPVGTTGQFLEGVAVSTGVRESVILTSPSDANGFAEIVSTQPITAYGLPVWIQGTPTFSTTPQTVNVSVASTQIVSSIPFYVAQSSAPWTMNGGMAVTNVPTVNVTNVPLVTVQGTSSVNVLNSVTVQGTSSVNVLSVGTVSTQIVSSIPFFVAGTTMVNIVSTVTQGANITSSIPFFVAQSSAPWTVTVPGTTMVNIVSTVPQSTLITSSIPFFVAQSSAPWTVNGAVSVSSQVVASSWPLSTTMVNVVSSIPFFVAQSSAPWSMVGTTTPNIVSSIPFFVAQSSAPWSFVETVSTAGGMSSVTIGLAATLNTTVVKASQGQLYAMAGSNIGSSNVFVRVLNASTAATAIASTGAAMVNFGMPISSSPFNNYDAGIPFSAGITIITQQQPYTASTSIAPTASTATVTIFFK